MLVYLLCSRSFGSRDNMDRINIHWKITEHRHGKWNKWIWPKNVHRFCPLYCRLSVFFLVPQKPNGKLWIRNFLSFSTRVWSDTHTHNSPPLYLFLLCHGKNPTCSELHVWTRHVIPHTRTSETHNVLSGDQWMIKKDNRVFLFSLDIFYLCSMTWFIHSVLR